MTSRGILYIATGERFVAEAEVSARSVRNVMPDTPIAIATDIEPDYNFDHTINIPDPGYGFVDKISHIDNSPFDETLYLDTDTYVNSSVGELFDILDKFDIALSYDHSRDHPQGIPDSFPEYNTGVIAYKNNDEFRQFTKAWKANHSEILSTVDTHDQPSFRKTLYESDLRIATLTPEYNCLIRFPGHVYDDVKIGHSRLLDIQSPGADKSVDVPKAVEELNNCEGHRIYQPSHKGGVHVFNMNDSLYKKAINSIRRDGVSHTIKKTVPFVLNKFINRYNNR
jgi:hypothetical protein